MAIKKCPGQDTKVWSDRDILEVQCPHCDQEMEFWKDDTSRKCPNCGKEVTNPNVPPAGDQA